MKFCALFFALVLVHVCSISALPDTHLEGFKQCSTGLKYCDVSYKPANVFKSILSDFGANNSLHINNVYQYLDKIMTSGGHNSTLGCCTWQMFAHNGYGLTTTVDFDIFLELCPAMLQIVNTAAKSNDPVKPSDTEVPPMATVWGYGFISVTLISLCSLLGISVLPLMKKKFYNKVLLYLICLAVGTLSSNAIFQLIPEGFGIEEDSMTVWYSAVIFCGFYMFYLFENVLERVFNGKHEHGHSDSRADSTKANQLQKIENSVSDDIFVEMDVLSNPSHATAQSKDQLLPSAMVNGKTIPENDYIPAIVEHEPSRSSACCWMFKNYKNIKTVAWMITIADGLHNFIDGLAIGASFSQSVVQGISTSIAIFCEEFPHELGDFAILLSAGMSVKQAAFYNFASACCCYIGLFVGIQVGHDVLAARWIFALAGGVFLYISLAGMLPEAQLQASQKEMKKTPWTALLIQNLGLLTGFMAMFLLTIYEHDIQILSQ
uniref:Zinc transporter ZIP14-like n=1 Tax=Phallusia mammillata TaxID=59560 RepID=A0A6F9DTD2_9ASCI|nr:zinc transporter ZIP14-like [Phallusia mammillata]